MQFKIFTIPIIAEGRELEELNHFLRANKIVDIKKDLTTANGNSFWTFCVTYLPITCLADLERSGQGKQSKIDYKDVLDADTFARFSRMRQLRKQIAESEAIPAYAVFTDAELAEMAKLDVLDLAHILKIQGIGKKKAEKYGNAFCQIDYTQQENEASGVSDGADS